MENRLSSDDPKLYLTSERHVHFDDCLLVASASFAVGFVLGAALQSRR
jgi:hypothetical protein